MSISSDYAARAIRHVEMNGGDVDEFIKSGLSAREFVATLKPAPVVRKPLAFGGMVDGILASVALGGDRRDPAGEAAEARENRGRPGFVVRDEAAIEGKCYGAFAGFDEADFEDDGERDDWADDVDGKAVRV